MEDYLNVIPVPFKISLAKEIDNDFFAPVLAEDKGVAVTFMVLLTADTPWQFTEDDKYHYATLKIAFRFAPGLRELTKGDGSFEGFTPTPVQLSYLISLWKVYTATDKEPKGKNPEASLEKLKGRLQPTEDKLYALAKAKFVKAIAMLQQY